MTCRCAVCGETHDGLPDIGFEWPDPYFDTPEAERKRRVRGSADTCVIDDDDHFVRGVILLPICGEDLEFGIGVWVSQQRENFATYVEHFDSAAIGPFFGWLSNRIPFYAQDTWAMKTMAHFRGGDQRPRIELAPSDHPLYREWSEGITLEQAWRHVHSLDR